MLKVVRCKGCTNATFQRPQMECQGLKVLETGFILRKSEFMMVYCIYDTAFYGFLGYNIFSYICCKFSGARDAQTQHFRDKKMEYQGLTLSEPGSENQSFPRGGGGGQKCPPFDLGVWGHWSGWKFRHMITYIQITRIPNFRTLT